jgi:cytoskeletal protein CcmA (bactofilin family)
VEGKIELKDHHLVIGPHGKINAEIEAKSVTVIGTVVGNICASELVEIKSTGSVTGDIRTSRIAFADGANFKGSVDMHPRTEAKKIELSPMDMAKAATPPSIAKT